MVLNFPGKDMPIIPTASPRVVKPFKFNNGFFSNYCMRMTLDGTCSKNVDVILFVRTDKHPTLYVCEAKLDLVAKY